MWKRMPQSEGQLATVPAAIDSSLELGTRPSRSHRHGLLRVGPFNGQSLICSAA